MNNRDLFVKLIGTADGDCRCEGWCVVTEYSGTVIGKKKIECQVKEVLFVPEARGNLTVRKVECTGMSVIFERGTVKILNVSEVVAIGKRGHLLYKLDF